MGKKFYEVDIKYKFWADFLSNNLEPTILLIVLFFFMMEEVRIYYFIIVAIYLVYLVAKTIYKMKKINSIDLKIYDDKLVYEINFLKQEKQEIYYKDIKDLRYSRKQIYNMFNVGEIYIVKREGSFFKNRIVIKGINNYKEFIEKLENVIMEYGKKNNLIKEEKN